jgi:hypothetical protein
MKLEWHEIASIALWLLNWTAAIAVAAYTLVCVCYIARLAAH